MKNLFSFFLVLCFAVGIAIAGDDSTDRKARYYFLEGARLAALDRDDEAYEYYKKAFNLNPAYTDAAYNYGTQRLIIRNDTLMSETEQNRSLDLIRQYVDSNPTDLFATSLYSYVTTRLDTIEESVRVLERITELVPTETYMLMNLAEAYMRSRQGEKALKALEKYESIEGKSEEVSMKKMTTLLLEEDTVAAIREARELIESNPRNLNFQMLYGNLYKLIGIGDSTRVAYERAERLNPDNGTVKVALASLYLEEGDSIAYDKKVFEALLSEDFELNDKLSILGGYLQRLIDEKGNRERGDHLFDVLMEQYPHEPEVLDLAARFNGANGDFSRAIEEISYAIDLDATNEMYWLQLMRYQFANDEPEESVKTYKRAEQFFEPTEDMTLLYGASLSELKDFKGAIDAYGKLINQDYPDLPITGKVDNQKLLRSLTYDELLRLSGLYNLLGDTYHLAGDKENAFTEYENSLYFFPDNPLTLNNYAYFLALSGGDLDKALEMSKKAIGASENNPTYLDTYAWILYMRKEYKEALDTQRYALEIAKEYGDENPEYYSHLGDILFMNHEPEEALENWKRALELDPDNALLKKKVEHKTFFFE